MGNPSNLGCRWSLHYYTYYTGVYPCRGEVLDLIAYLRSGDKPKDVALEWGHSSPDNPIGQPSF